MGEFADMTLDDIDWDLEDEYGEGIKCKYCGLNFLHWEEARGERNQKKWVLMDGQNIHDCPKFSGPARDDEFEDLTAKPRARKLRRPSKGGP